LGAIAVAGLGIPFAMQILWVNKTGFITQGRYLLAVASGLPILGAYLIQRYGMSATTSRAVLRCCVVTLLPIHFAFLWYTMVRWQHGIDWKQGLHGLNPLAGPWHPPLGSAPPLIVGAAGILMVGWLLWDVASAGSRKSTSLTESPTERPVEETQQHGPADRVASRVWSSADATAPTP